MPRSVICPIDESHLSSEVRSKAFRLSIYYYSAAETAKAIKSDYERCLEILNVLQSAPETITIRQRKFLADYKDQFALIPPPQKHWAAPLVIMPPSMMQLLFAQVLKLAPTPTPSLHAKPLPESAIESMTKEQINSITHAPDLVNILIQKVKIKVGVSIAKAEAPPIKEAIEKKLKLCVDALEAIEQGTETREQLTFLGDYSSEFSIVMPPHPDNRWKLRPVSSTELMFWQVLKLAQGPKGHASFARPLAEIDDLISAVTSIAKTKENDSVAIAEVDALVTGKSDSGSITGVEVSSTDKADASELGKSNSLPVTATHNSPASGVSADLSKEQKIRTLLDELKSVQPQQTLDPRTRIASAIIEKLHKDLSAASTTYFVNPNPKNWEQFVVTTDTAIADAQRVFSANDSFWHDTFMPKIISIINDIREAFGCKAVPVIPSDFVIAQSETRKKIGFFKDLRAVANKEEDPAPEIRGMQPD